MKNDESIEFFKKLRDVADGVVKAYEAEDEKLLEDAMGRFLLLMIQMDALK
jgi:hypothetical protein